MDGLKCFITYVKKKWLINELLIMCVQEEERLKYVTPESVHYTNHVKENAKKGKGAPRKNKAGVQMKQDSNKDKYHFCKKMGHFKKDCAKYEK